MVAHVFMGDPVELVGGDSGGDRLRGLGQSASGNLSRTADPFNRVRSFDVGGGHPLGAVVKHVLGAGDRAGDVAIGTEPALRESAAGSAIGQGRR